MLNLFYSLKLPYKAIQFYLNLFFQLNGFIKTYFWEQLFRVSHLGIDIHWGEYIFPSLLTQLRTNKSQLQATEDADCTYISLCPIPPLTFPAN